MSMTKSPEDQDIALSRDLLYAARYYLGRRGVLLGLAGIATVAGFALNWSWLVAAGLAPLLLGALPCVAMCALGLCMNKMIGRSCSTESAPEKMTEITREARTSGSVVQTPAVMLEGPAREIESDAIPASGDQSERPVEERRKIDA